MLQYFIALKAVDNRNGTFTLKVILTDFQYSQILILAQSNSDALTTISPEIIVINCQRLNGLISNQKRCNAYGSLYSKWIFSHWAFHNTQVKLFESCIVDQIVKEELKALATDHIWRQVQRGQSGLVYDILDSMHTVVCDSVVRQMELVNVRSVLNRIWKCYNRRNAQS